MLNILLNMYTNDAQRFVKYAYQLWASNLWMEGLTYEGAASGIFPEDDRLLTLLVILL